MKIEFIILILISMMSVTLLIFIYTFGNKFSKMYRLILDDAVDYNDLMVRRNFMKTAMHSFAILFFVLITEIALLCTAIIFYH